MSYKYNSNNNSSCNNNWALANPSNSTQITPKSLGVELVNEFYNHVEAHLKGVTKVLKPILQLNNIITGEARHCKSDDHCTRGGGTSVTNIPYYTPQKTKCHCIKSNDCQCNHHHCRQYCKCNGKSSVKQLNTDRMQNLSTSNKSTCKLSCDIAASSTILPLSNANNNNYSKLSSHSSSILNENKSFIHYHDKSNNTNYQQLQSKNCSVCGININKVKILALVPCKHLFCYPCMSQIQLNICPKCSRPLKRETIRNITINNT